jgi:CO dehydrogenase maturation factor
VSLTIAVSGKGGTGKTTFAGMIIRYLMEKKRGPILAVDADSNTNLNEVLGIDVKSTIGEMRELMKNKVPTGMTKDVWFEYKVQEALTEAQGFDLLAMGRSEGAGCYCAANSLARKYIDLLTGNYPFIVIDNEAGMEHFSRLTTRDVDLLFILSDSSRRGIITAARIRDIVLELKLNISRELLILNRITGAVSDDILREISNKKLELAGAIPADEEINSYDLRGIPTYQLPLETPALQAAWRIFDAVIV